MGKTIHSEERTLILKVLKFFESEKANKQYIIPVDQVVKRTWAATGISKFTLMKIKQEARELRQASPPRASPSTSQVKQRVADKNVSQSEKEIEKLTRDAINSITPSDWKKEVNHVERLQQEYWEKDHLEEENVREFIISLGEESSDSEISDSDDELMTGIEPIIYSEDDS
ncbi:hypothetical protein ACJJTC_001897 [Scirpophaga incertulas]